MNTDAPLRQAIAQTANYRRLFELLRQLSYQRRSVTLASGRKSDFYIDCRRTVLGAEGHFLSGWLINRFLMHAYPDVVGIGGMSIGADPLVSATATTSYLGARPLDAFYVRKQAKSHGTGQRVELCADLEAGARVAILEDVITSGGSALSAVERAREVGLQPECVVALVDRQEGGREAVERQLPLTAFYAAADFLAAEQGSQ